MRSAQVLASILSLAAFASAFSPLSDLRGLQDKLSLRRQFSQDRLQTPMNPGPQIPQPPADQTNDEAGGGGGNSGGDNDGSSALTISDILPKSRSINIFASLTRDVAQVSERLESTAPASNTTLLAPLNSAMQALPRKPWEDRPDDDSGISASRNEDKAAQNLRRFVEEHVVPISPWEAGKDHKIKTLGGQELYWEERNGKKVIMPGEIVVDGVVGRVGNGEIWSLKEVVNYEVK